MGDILSLMLGITMLGVALVLSVAAVGVVIVDPLAGLIAAPILWLGWRAARKLFRACIA